MEPVFRTFYRELRDFGAEPINRFATAFDGSKLMEHEIHIDDYAEPAHQQTADFLESVWTFADFGGPVADWNQFLPSLDVSRRLGDNGTLNWRALKYWRELKR